MPLVYRAVSDVEFEQILRTGRFETVPSGCEGKHFADTIKGAMKFGNLMFGVGHFQIVEADTPELATSLFCWSNLDGCGPCRFLHIDDLADVLPKVHESEAGI